jgi:hypothetical protein
MPSVGGFHLNGINWRSAMILPSCARHKQEREKKLRDFVNQYAGHAYYWVPKVKGLSTKSARKK